MLGAVAAHTCSRVSILLIATLPSLMILRAIAIKPLPTCACACLPFLSLLLVRGQALPRGSPA